MRRQIHIQVNSSDSDDVSLLKNTFQAKEMS